MLVVLSRALVPPLASVSGIFLATFFVSAAVLGGSPDRAATSFALALLVALAAALIAFAWGALRSLLCTLVALVVAASMVAPRPADSGALLADLVRSTLPWATLLCAGLGLVLLRLVRRGPLPDTPARHWGAVASYLLATLGLASWLAWSGPLTTLAGAHAAPTLERQAIDLLALVLALGTAAQLALAALLPARHWRRAVTADLVVLLSLLALPLITGIVGRRAPLVVEGWFRIAWVALALAALVALRVLVALVAVRAAALQGQVGDRRLALALLAICLSAYWPAAAWRATNVKLTGDEPQYLAAAMSLWRHGDLEITRTALSPEMAGLVLDGGDVRADIYEDQARDRLGVSVATAAGTALYLPVVGGQGLSARLALANPGLQAAVVKVH